MANRVYFPGTRVLAFDSRLFVDDVITPLSVTMRPAEVVCWYGKETSCGRYDSLVDLLFDHDGHVSRGHFTWNGKELEVLH